MPSIANLYVQILPETSRIADGVVRAWREVDPKAAEAGRRWGREIQRGLGDTTVELKADTKKARAEIDEAAKDKKATVEVDADTAKAEAQIDVASRDRKATIEVDADTLVSSAQRSFSQMAPAFAGAGTQLSQSLAGAGASAAPQVGGSLSGAMGPVGSAMTASLVAGAVAAVAGIAAALSGVVGLIPAGIAGAGSVIGTLVTGLDGVKDAWDAAGKAADSSGKDQEEKAKSVASAQKSLRDAVLDESNAQKDVANARKDARQQLEDLNVQLRGGVIDEKQAILDAQAARRDLATGRFRDRIEYEQAQLRVQAADQRVLESHERNVHLQDRATDANQKGIEKSDQVVAAQQRLVKSQQDVATAVQNLAAAQSKTSSTADAFVLAMGKISPNARQFIQTLEGLKPAWDALKFSVQDSLFAGIGPELQKMASQYLPVLQGMMTNLAGTMNTAFKDIGAWLSKPETMASIQQIVANIGSSFQIWSQSLVPFSQAFLTITQVGSGFLPQLAQMITEGANAFNNFIQNAARTGELQQWIQTGITALREIIGLVPILGKMFLDLAPIGIPILQTIGMLLRNLEPLFQAIGIAGAQYQNGVNQFWAAIGRLADKLNEIVQVVWPPMHSMLDTLDAVFTRVFNNISAAIEKAWKVIKPIFDAIKRALDDFKIGGISLGDITKGLGGLFNNSGSGGTPTPSTTAPFKAGPPVAGSSWARSGPSTAPSGFNWDAVMPHEGGTWNNADTGHNGHYGGLQFAPDTWAAYGGLEFAPRPDLATPEQQKIVADRTAFTGWNGKAPQGLGAWQAITDGKVPGITTNSQPTGLPAAGLGGINLSSLPNVKGAHPQLAAALAAAQQMFPGLTLTAGRDDHPMDQGWHPRGQAIDIGGGTPEQQAALSNWLLQFAPEIEELIHSGPGVTQNIKSGKVGPAIDMPGSVYSTGQAGYHGDHVHLAITDQQAQAFMAALGSPNLSGLYPSAAGQPTIANPQGVSPDGVPLGTQNQPYYVMPAQGSSGAEQFGQDFLDGILEIFGIDGSVFKNPFGGGLFKGFKGLMSALTGGGKGGYPAAAYGGDGAALPGVGGGDVIGGLLGSLSLPGFTPQAYGNVTPGGPATAPVPFMLSPAGGNTFSQMGGGVTGLPGGGLPNLKLAQPQPNNVTVDNSINFNQPVGNMQQAGNVAKELNVPRARQGLTGLPGG